MIRPSCRCLLIATICYSFIFEVILARNNNPYETLRVSRNASQQDIKKSYKSLCLKYHPDKNVQISPKERSACEAKFKEIQHAYSLIGDENSRRSYDVQEVYGNRGPFHTQRSTSKSSSSAPKFNDPLAEAFFRAFSSREPSFYFSQGANGMPRFGVRRAFPMGPTDFVSNASFKSIYTQKVKVPLEKLYTGTEIELHVVDNLWTRWRAAIRGRIIYLSLYQGLLYSLPTVRTSKVLAAIIGIFITHATLPKPSVLNFTSTLPRGTKGNGKTRIRFKQSQNTEPEIIFEIEEEQHRRYTRVDNDLHAHIQISGREAARGCTKRLASLDPAQSPIVIEIPPHLPNGKTIRIRGKGWPTRNADIHGDLLVKVEIKDEKSGNCNNRGKRKKNS